MLQCQKIVLAEAQGPQGPRHHHPPEKALRGPWGGSDGRTSLHKGYLLSFFLSPLMAGLFWEVKTKKAQGLCTGPAKRKSSSGGGERRWGAGVGSGGGEPGCGGGRQVSKTSQTLETSSVPSLLFFIAGPPRPGEGRGKLLWPGTQPALLRLHCCPISKEQRLFPSGAGTLALSPVGWHSVSSTQNGEAGGG